MRPNPVDRKLTLPDNAFFQVCAVAVTFRQTNIIWALFILGTALLDLASTSERRKFDPKAVFLHSPLQLIHALDGFVRMLFAKLPNAIAMALPYLGLLAGFAAFVKWNGGIVLGKSISNRLLKQEDSTLTR